MKVNFYRVKVEREDLDFTDIIRTALRTPDDKSRAILIRGFPIRLQFANESSDFWSGDMIRIRMNEVPTKASLDGDTESINLEDDEGIGEETAFLFHIPSNVLLLQRNHVGVSAASFATYFKEIGDIGSSLYLEPILAGDALNRIRQMGIIKKFEINAAGLDRMDILRNENDAVDQFLDIRDTFRAPNIHLSMSVGNRKDTFLENTKVLNTALALFKFSRAPEVKVKTIKISGAIDETDHTEVIDLFEYWIKEEINLKRQGTERAVSYKERSDAIKEAWVRRVNELSKMFDFKKKPALTSS